MGAREALAVDGCGWECGIIQSRGNIGCGWLCLKAMEGRHWLWLAVVGWNQVAVGRMVDWVGLAEMDLLHLISPTQYHD